MGGDVPPSGERRHFQPPLSPAAHPRDQARAAFRRKHASPRRSRVRRAAHGSRREWPRILRLSTHQQERNRTWWRGRDIAPPSPRPSADRQNGVLGKVWAVRLEPGGRRYIKKKKDKPTK